MRVCLLQGHPRSFCLVLTLTKVAMLSCPLYQATWGRALVPDAQEITSLAGVFTARLRRAALLSALSVARLHWLLCLASKTEP